MNVNRVPINLTSLRQFYHLLNHWPECARPPYHYDRHARSSRARWAAITTSPQRRRGANPKASSGFIIVTSRSVSRTHLLVRGQQWSRSPRAASLWRLHARSPEETSRPTLVVHYKVSDPPSDRKAYGGQEHRELEQALPCVYRFFTSRTPRSDVPVWSLLPRFITAVCSIALLLAVRYRGAPERVRTSPGAGGRTTSHRIGLVVGLDGTATNQPGAVQPSTQNMLVRFGVTIRDHHPQPGTWPRSWCSICRRSPGPDSRSTHRIVDRNSAACGALVLIMTPLRARIARCTMRRAAWCRGFGISRQGWQHASRQRSLAGRVPKARRWSAKWPGGHSAEPFVILNLHVPDFTTSARRTEHQQLRARDRAVDVRPSSFRWPRLPTQ